MKACALLSAFHILSLKAEHSSQAAYSFSADLLRLLHHACLSSSLTLLSGEPLKDSLKLNLCSQHRLNNRTHTASSCMIPKQSWNPVVYSTETNPSNEAHS